ncbi:LPP leucine zipper domain-containing protein [Salmonella enterica]
MCFHPRRSSYLVQAAKDDAARANQRLDNKDKIKPHY